MRKNDKLFASNLVKRLSNDQNSPFYGKMSDNLSNNLYHHLIKIMSDDNNRDVGFELIIDLYENQDEIYKKILPLIKSYFYIASNILKIDIFKVKNLNFLFTNLDNIINIDLLNNWEFGLHNLINNYEEDLIIEDIKVDKNQQNLLFNK